MPRISTLILAACSALAAGCAIAAAQDRAVDLELVLSVDASGSVDHDEYLLQIGGIAAAFRDPDVQAAIASGPLGRIGVAMSVWAGATVPKDQSDWFEIATPGHAEAFAAIIERFPRRVVGGTGIGAGIAHSIRLMDYNGMQGLRRVVDVSGDGIETPPRQIVVQIDQARAMADARGVTVNGLAILSDVPTLDVWYRRRVKTGPGSFVMTAATFEDFAVAMRAKLLREIGALPPVAALDSPRG